MKCYKCQKPSRVKVDFRSGLWYGLCENCYNIASSTTLKETLADISQLKKLKTYDGLASEQGDVDIDLIEPSPGEAV